MQINKDTFIYGSFSTTPGNNGCMFFNAEFERLGLNAIYKSFYSDDIKKSFNAAKTLGFKGFAVSMPFKKDIITLLSKVDTTALLIGAVNTVVLEDGIYVGYNTDWAGVKRFLEERNVKSISIAGTGGFSKAIQYACEISDIKYEVLSRQDINSGLQPKYDLFNATPIGIDCKYDGRPTTDDGRVIARYQAEKQLELYVEKK